MSYRLHHSAGAILLETGEHVRKGDPGWQAYREWIRGGGIPEPALLELEPIAAIAERLCSEIDQERVLRHNAPATYAGNVFDADGDARESISGTIARLVRGDTLPENWIGWRDYANAMHWAEFEAAAVLLELRGLACVIEDRKQALLIVAWTKKAEVAALAAAEDRAGLGLYDVKGGWPE